MRDDQAAKRPLWKIGLAVYGAALGIGLALAFVNFRSDYSFCKVVMPQQVQAASGDAMLMDYRFCSLFEHEDGTAVVRLKREGSSRSTIVFAYTPSEPKEDTPHPQLYPDVSWDDDGHVSIAIDRVLQVHRKLEEADGIQFEYAIGKVEFAPD